MYEFNDFDIEQKSGGLEGKKASVFEILNQEIIIHSYEVKPSKITDKGSGICLHMQIEYEGLKRAFFCGSKILKGLLEQVPKDRFPFKATIIKNGERFEFKKKEKQQQ